MVTWLGWSTRSMSATARGRDHAVTGPWVEPSSARLTPSAGIDTDGVVGTGVGTGRGTGPAEQLASPTAPTAPAAARARSLRRGTVSSGRCTRRPYLVPRGLRPPVAAPAAGHRAPS